MDENNSSSTIASLPAEVKEMIFAHLYEQGAQNARLVCRQWNEIISAKTFSLKNPHLNLPYHKVYMMVHRESNRENFFKNSFLRRQFLSYYKDEDARAYFFFAKSHIATFPHGLYRHFGYELYFYNKVFKSIESFNLLYSYTLRFSPEDSDRVLRDYLSSLYLFKEALPEFKWLVLLMEVSFIVGQEESMLLERSLLEYHPLEETALQKNEEKQKKAQRKKAIRTMVLATQILIGLSSLISIVMGIVL